MQLTRLPLSDGTLCWCPHFVPAEECSRLFNRLLYSLCWRQERIHLFGRNLVQPRLTAWYGDPDARYRYSGVTLEPSPWLPVLADLRLRLSKALQHDFNSVLANLYRTGEDSMGWHSDNEPELGRQPVIASLSLGATRRFDLRHRRSGARHQLELEDGSLLMMAGTLQQCWQHRIAKTKRPIGPRINLTFRRICSAAQSRSNTATDST